MDWDWEDGPPQDAPRRRPEESPQSPAPETPSFSDAVEHFDQTAQPDDERTQVIRRQPPGDEERPAAERPVDAPPPAPSETPSFAEVIDRFETPVPGPYPPSGDLQGPRLRTNEAAQRSLGADAQERRSGERAPRPPADRAAARARRRKQIRRRRLVALAVIVLIVVLLVVLVVRGCGGPSEGQASTMLHVSSPVALHSSTPSQPLRVAVMDSVTVGWHLPAFMEGQ